MTELIKQPPAKPYKNGKISGEFGGPATSALDVLQRARVAISPRGAWSSRGLTRKNPSGHGRCLIQITRDVDGVHADAAQAIIKQAIEKHTGKKRDIASFNDDSKTHKHDAIAVLDIAIEIAKKEGK